MAVDKLDEITPLDLMDALTQSLKQKQSEIRVN